MISLIEKDGSYIITIEAPTYNEQQLVKHIRSLCREAQEHPQTVQQNNLPDKEYGIDWSRFRCNQFTVSQPVWYRLVVLNKDKSVYMDYTYTKREDLDFMADWYRGQGYEATVTETETNARENIIPSVSPETALYENQRESQTGFSKELEEMGFEEIPYDEGIPF